MLTSLDARPGPPGHALAVFLFPFERGALAFLFLPLGTESRTHTALLVRRAGYYQVMVSMLRQAATAEPVTTRSAHGGPILNQIIFERYEH